MSGHVDINKRNVDLKEAEKCLESTKKCMEDLDRSVHSLPSVDEKGNSECPFAEELYAKKEELQKTLEARLKDLFEMMKAVDAEIKRCGKNLAVVTAHQDRIHSETVRDQYSDEELKLAARIKQLTEIREQIQKAIKAVQEALAESKARYYPGSEPGEWPAISDDSPAPPLPGSDAEGELNDIYEYEKERQRAAGG